MNEHLQCGAAYSLLSIALTGISGSFARAGAYPVAVHVVDFLAVLAVVSSILHLLDYRSPEARDRERRKHVSFHPGAANIGPLSKTLLARRYENNNNRESSDQQTKGNLDEN